MEQFHSPVGYLPHNHLLCFQTCNYLEMADVWKLSDAGSQLVCMCIYIYTLCYTNCRPYIQMNKNNEKLKKLLLFHKSQNMIIEL